MNQAQKIIADFPDLASCEAEAKRICVHKDELSGWDCIYTFADGSTLKREFMPGACEEDSRIRVVQ